MKVLLYENRFVHLLLSVAIRELASAVTLTTPVGWLCARMNYSVLVSITWFLVLASTTLKAWLSVDWIMLFGWSVAFEGTPLVSVVIVTVPIPVLCPVRVSMVLIDEVVLATLHPTCYTPVGLPKETFLALKATFPLMKVTGVLFVWLFEQCVMNRCGGCVSFRLIVRTVFTLSCVTLCLLRILTCMPCMFLKVVCECLMKSLGQIVPLGLAMRLCVKWMVLVMRC